MKASAAANCAEIRLSLRLRQLEDIRCRATDPHEVADLTREIDALALSIEASQQLRRVSHRIAKRPVRARVP